MKLEDYVKLAYQYDLPSFEELDFEFEINTIEKSNFLLRDIIRRINEKLDNTELILSEILHPDGSRFCSLVECQMFEDNDKKHLAEINRRLCALQKQLFVAIYSVNDKVCAETIKEVMIEWPQLRSALLPYFRKIKSGWKEVKDSIEKQNYLG